MATESTGGRDLSVTVPPPLAEWLDERAATLDVDREELLVRLAGAYRAAADLDDPIAEHADAEETLAELDDRVEALESDLESDVEDLRRRVLQLRDAVGDRAAADHAHEEFGTFEDRLEELSDGLAGVEADLEEATDRIEAVTSELDEAGTKLLRVARAVVALRSEFDADESDDERRLEELREAANRNGLVEADCAACGTRVNVALLTEAACPHCGTALGGVKPAAPGLGRALGFRRPELTVADRTPAPDAAPSVEEADDE